MSINRYCLSLAAALALNFGLVGCGKDPAFQYKLPPDQTREYNQVHQIKSLVGGSADIVWVIDNSGSMGDEQQAIADNTRIFMQKFQALARGMDWRMGLISTDISDSPYIGFDPNDRLDGRTVDPVLAFQQAVSRLGTNGDSTERSFDPIMQAFRRYPDFLRPNAKLFLILVSDEEEQSNASSQGFLNYLVSLKGSPGNISTYGILEDDQCPGGGSYRGSKYEEFMTLTNGRLFSICSNNYGDLLADIGNDIGRQLTSPRIPLGARPDLKTMQIFYRNQFLPGGPREMGGYWIYDYDANAIVFHDLNFALGENESVRVVYRFLDM